MEPLRVLNGGKTLVVYAYHQFNRNLRFFLRHGMVPHNRVDYAFVQNHAEWDPKRPAQVNEKHIGRSLVYWINRNNLANDFGAHSEALRQIDTTGYDYFVFLNSSVRGPFVSTAASDPTEHWSVIFSRRLTNQVALTGSTINYHDGTPHVQSMVMCMDQRGLAVYREEEVFLSKDRYISKGQLIHKHEIRGSTALLKRGYNLDCLLTAFQGKDWRLPSQEFLPHKPIHNDLWGDRRYFGYNLNPYETVFFKTNRTYDRKFTIMPLLTEWYENQEYANIEEPQQHLSKGEPTNLMHPADEFLRDSDYVDDDARYIMDSENPDTDELEAASRWRVKQWAWIAATTLLGILTVVFMVLWLIK